MITKDVKSLLQKLNDHITRALEAAAGFCITRTHYEVSPEHLLIKLLEDGKGDIPRIFSYFEVDSGKVWEALLRTLEGFKVGNQGKPTFSPNLLSLIESAWVASSVHHNQNRIRSGALLEVLLEAEGFRFGEYIDELETIRRDELRRNFINIVAGSVEDQLAQAVRPGTEAPLQKRAGETALDLYTIDLTGLARAGEIDPAVGRDKEMRQIIDILSRRRKNNPILVGEAGVGKTHVVEGLALRIAEGDVPKSLAEVEIRTLDIGLLEAGAGIKGEFENRLKSVIAEVKEAPKPTILFIDEAHTLIGAGGPAGGSDAANLLKPALARGELRTIAATTWSEYKKYFERDAALERRFQMVKIDEPDAENACVMLRGIKGIYEDHHRVYISDEAVQTAVQLSQRYIPARQLPDKAVDLLDTSSARVKMGYSSKPAQLDDVERRLQNLATRIAAVRRDIDTGVHNDEASLLAFEQEKSEVEAQRDRLNERWTRELELVDEIQTLRSQLAEHKEKLRQQSDSPPAPMESEQQVESESQEEAISQELQPPEIKEKIINIESELERVTKELQEVQGDSPLAHVEVNGDIVAKVVSDWTGIPVGNMLKDEADVLLNLERLLEEHILGQSHAISEIGDTIRTSKAGLRNPESPIGVFLFVGPSGVGKTECGRMVAELLFGGEHFLTTINLSEYQEPHTVSQLKGSPPGYVGYGEGGVLTEAVRQRPYSVILLDEVEKAHRDVLNLFYQVFDKGFMRDGEGREIDFKNTVIMMTGNLGSDIILDACDNGNYPSPEELTEAIRPTLQMHFGAAFLGRLKIIPFYPLDVETMKGIVKLKLAKIGLRLKESHNMDFEYSQDLVTRIAERCTQVDTGARNIDYIIERTILPGISVALLEQLAEETKPNQLVLELDDVGEFQYQFD
jgi:type VI secretion system protein VasG